MKNNYQKKNNENELNHKSFGFSFKSEDVNEDEGIIIGYGATFNVLDSYRDVILPKAFMKCLSEKRSFPLLYQHDTNQQIGVVTVHEDEYGLKMKAQYYLNTTLGREKFELAKANAKAGLINTEFSIGYRAIMYKYGEFEGVDCTYIEEILLKEISQVTIASNSHAIALDIKSEVNVRKIENNLRDAGLTKKQALKYSSMIKSDIFDSSDSVEDEQSDSVEEIKDAVVGDTEVEKPEAFKTEHIEELKSFMDELNLITKIKTGMI